MKAIGYIRVSTQDQVDSGLGLENQRAKIYSFCNAKEWEIEDIIEENGVSGSVPIEERKEGAKLCEMIKDKKLGIKAVVMLRLDRGFRNTEDCLKTTREWTRKGVGVHFIDMAGMDATTSMGVLQMTMMAGFSEFERSLIRDRTRAALAVKRSRGEKTGGIVPYGFAWTMNAEGKKILVHQKQEQEVIGLIKKMRGMNMSPEKIAAKLNGAGVKSKLGKPWQFKQVYRILAREDNNEKSK